MTNSPSSSFSGDRHRIESCQFQRGTVNVFLGLRRQILWLAYRSLSRSQLRLWAGVLVLLVCAVSRAQSTSSDFPDFNDLMKNAGQSRPSEQRNSLPASDGTRGNELPSGFQPRDNTRPLIEGSRDRAPDDRPAFGPISFPKTLDESTESDTFRETETGSPAEKQNSAGRSMPAALIDPNKGFDWHRQRVSVADLRFPTVSGTGSDTSVAFEHGEPFLTEAEESAYLDLVDAIAAQRRALLQQAARELSNSARNRSDWERAFYQYENARRLAWDNGHLQAFAREELIGGLPNPFTDPVEQVADDEYSLLRDVNRFPEDFVGKPIVLYGVFKASERLQIGQELPRAMVAEEGSGMSADRPPLTVLRGSLLTLAGDMQVATVDTRGLLTPQKGLLSIQNSPPSRDEAYPVLVKGWVVKKWNTGPLVYCESLRQISPIPHFELIRQTTVDQHRLKQEETWLYYETLRQMELTSPKLQRETAASVLQQRIANLMRELENETSRDLLASQEKQKAGKISESEFRQHKNALTRRLNHRMARYRRFQQSPELFQTYVDMFQYPDIYHGHLVTLRGHVRHVVSYPADDAMFRGNRMLHELWLFTDDSQHNPAVIITPTLPADFPREAEVIDRVSVTGCFFKRYVYGSQDTTRVAPLVLAGSVNWTPTVDQVASLVKDGHLAADSARAAKAAAMNEGLSRTAVTTIGFFVVFVIMVLWGRAQREERDRVRLRKRVNELPEFENPPLPGYSLPLYDPSAE